MKEQNLQLFCLHKHDGALPIAMGTIGMKVETKEGEDSSLLLYCLIIQHNEKYL
jgi:hypothetical protein